MNFQGALRLVEASTTRPRSMDISDYARLPRPRSGYGPLLNRPHGVLWCENIVLVGEAPGTRHRADKGFGFIEQEGGGLDVFAHHSNIVSQGFRELREGQQVEFDVVQG